MAKRKFRIRHHLLIRFSGRGALSAYAYEICVGSRSYVRCKDSRARDSSTAQQNKKTKHVSKGTRITIPMYRFFPHIPLSITNQEHSRGVLTPWSEVVDGRRRGKEEKKERSSLLTAHCESRFAFSRTPHSASPPFCQSARL